MRVYESITEIIKNVLLVAKQKIINSAYQCTKPMKITTIVK